MYLIELKVNKYTNEQEIKSKKLTIEKEHDNYFEIYEDDRLKYVYKEDAEDVILDNDDFYLNTLLLKKSFILNHLETYKLYVLDEEEGKHLIVQYVLNHYRDEILNLESLKNELIESFGQKNDKNYNQMAKETVKEIYFELYSKELSIDNLLFLLQNGLPKELLQLAKTFSWKNEYVRKKVKEYLKEKGEL